ncbi:hypothetical protein CCYA_CCYA13G3485 [Cyanidiococcus yangmingshanensis]|nr:hypothetical protein CCYA_CCYA13G3485 [Cyanidiococcus yangmingshanensis]
MAFVSFAGFALERARCCWLGARQSVAECTACRSGRRQQRWLVASGFPGSRPPHAHEPVHHDGSHRPGERKGFVQEMRVVAMRLHTKDQAREGKQEESALPISEWRPTRADFLQFLVDSKAVYDFLEGYVASEGAKGNPLFKPFVNTGLERGQALANDIAWFRNTLGYSIPEPTDAARRYIDYLRELFERSPEAVLCHWYNFYFAHTAGGRMIGRNMENLLFGNGPDAKRFAFYEWDRDVKEILEEVRGRIDEVAKDWPREVKDVCLNETGLAFAYSGTILNNLAKRAEEPAAAS